MSEKKVSIYHNILWSKYKGVVFSALHALSKNYDLKFFQIAETENDRVGLSVVDLHYHNYPFTLLYPGAYESKHWVIRSILLIKTIFKNRSDFTILPGYHLPEYWVMLFVIKILRHKVGVFCDSTEYDRPQGKVKGLLKRIFFNRCDAFFCYGSRSTDYLLKYGVARSKIFHRCQAAALSMNYHSRDVVELRRKYQSAGDTIQILYVGRLAPEKNLDYLIREFDKLLKEYPSALLRIVGSGPLKSELQDLVRVLNLSDKVIFPGSMNIDELEIEYLKSSFFVLPSKSEPWGLVINESLSFGCPVLVSDHCGCAPELVVEGVTGYVFDPNVENSLYESFKKIIYMKGDAVSKNCLAHIANYSPSAAAQQIDRGISLTLD